MQSTTYSPELPSVTPVKILAGGTAVYDVTMEVTIPASVPPVALQCTPGNGLVNQGILVSGNQTQTDDACQSIDPPTIAHDKTVKSATQNTDGTWTVVYEIAVTNTGTVSGFYSLSDTLALNVPNVMSIVGTPVATGPTDPTDWNGTSSTVLATDRPLIKGGSEKYTITAVVSVLQGPGRHRGRALRDRWWHQRVPERLGTHRCGRHHAGQRVRDPHQADRGQGLRVRDLHRRADLGRDVQDHCYEHGAERERRTTTR